METERVRETTPKVTFGYLKGEELGLRGGHNMAVPFHAAILGVLLISI